MTLHWLRPEWFFALLPLVLLLFLQLKKTTRSRQLAHWVDVPLQRHLLTRQSTEKISRFRLLVKILMFLLALIVIVALAGPAWKKLPQPVFQQQSALVILLDLSRSMDAQDIKPSRLSRVMLKLRDLLQMRGEGQTALIAYAANAFTVSPLTDDTRTIASLLAALSTEIMPAQGSRADHAVEKALALLQGAGATRGDLLLITDGLSQQEQQGIRHTLRPGITLSVLAAGTVEGAPIPLAGGGFVKDDKGSIVIASTPMTALRSISNEFNGRFEPLQSSERDVRNLQIFFSRENGTDSTQVENLKADQWREEGPWLLLFILPFAALLFRKNLLPGLLLLLVILPQPQPVMAAEEGLSFWDQWFKNPQQQGELLMQRDNPQAAAQQFTDPQWKAGALYESGDYQQALQQWRNSDDHSVDSKYNEANALAKLGQLQEALQAYDEVLEQHPDHEDAQYNRQQVQQALEQQQQQQQNQQSQAQQDQAQQDQTDQNSQNSNDQQQGDSDSESANQENQSDTQQSQSESSESSADSQQDSQQQQAEESSATQASNAVDSESQQTQQDQNTVQQQQQGNQDSADDENFASNQQQQDQQQQDQQQQQAAQVMQEDQQPEQQHEENSSDEKAGAATANLSQQEILDQQAEAQWLRKIPDDPAGLLRNKFLYQYQQQRQRNTENQQW